jgi:hypothetical protein
MLSNVLQLGLAPGIVRQLFFCFPNVVLPSCYDSSMWKVRYFVEKLLRNDWFVLA